MSSLPFLNHSVLTLPASTAKFSVHDRQGVHEAAKWSRVFEPKMNGSDCVWGCLKWRTRTWVGWGGCLSMLKDSLAGVSKVMRIFMWPINPARSQRPSWGRGCPSKQQAAWLKLWEHPWEDVRGPTARRCILVGCGPAWGAFDSVGYEERSMPVKEGS